MEMTQKYYHIDKKDIHFFQFLLEAYEGIAMFETIDANKGLILVHIACGAEDEFYKLVQDLKKDINIYEMP